MAADRRRCGLVAAAGNFGFLIFWCATPEPALSSQRQRWPAAMGSQSPHLGALMILTLKATSGAINYQDGLLPDGDHSLRESQRRHRLTRLPTVLEFLGYNLCCGLHLAGPVYEISDYIAWTEDKQLWAGSKEMPRPRLHEAATAAFARGLVAMCLYVVLAPWAPPGFILDSAFRALPLWRRLGYILFVGFVARWKYYFIWSVAEAAMILSGLGFSGWREEKGRKVATWDSARNVDIMAVELATSTVDFPVHWNISVSHWLRLCILKSLLLMLVLCLWCHLGGDCETTLTLSAPDVYERLVQSGQKPGFRQLLATQVTSALWHGLYPGYLVFFVNMAIAIAGSRVIYKWQKAVPPKSAGAARVLMLGHTLYTTLTLNYGAIGFLLLNGRDTLAAFSSVLYLGTALPCLVLAAGKIIKLPRKQAAAVNGSALQEPCQPKKEL
eukprot:SM000317S12246  [mRNA]  locus=s317:25144:28231:+ [translate_table: standard]